MNENKNTINKYLIENNNLNLYYFKKNYEKFLNENYYIDIDLIINELKETINKNNIRLYNIEIDYNNNLLIIRLNNLLINEKNKLNELNKLCNTLKENYNIYNYKIEYLYIIEIELN